MILWHVIDGYECADCGYPNDEYEEEEYEEDYDDE